MVEGNERVALELQGGNFFLDVDKSLLEVRSFEGLAVCMAMKVEAAGLGEGTGGGAHDECRVRLKRAVKECEGGPGSSERKGKG